MKKFLSSLLALTMILSLVIVPANAHDDTMTGATMSGDNSVRMYFTGLTYSVNTSSLKLASDNSTITPSDITYAWTATGKLVIDGDADEATVSVNATGSGSEASTLQCVVTATYTPASSESEQIATHTTTQVTQTVTKNVTVTAFSASDVSTVKVNGRTYSVSGGSVTAYYFGDTNDLGDYSATATGYTVTGVTKNTTPNKTLTIKAKRNSTAEEEKVNINLTETQATDVSVSISNNFSGNNPIVGHEYTLTATYTHANKTSDSSAIKYTWTVGNGSITNTSDPNVIKWTPDADGSCKVTCTVKEGNNKAADTAATYTVDKELFKAVSTNDSTTIALTPDHNTEEITTPAIQRKDGTGSTYTVSSSDPNKVTWKSLSYEDNSDKAYVSISGHNVTGLKKGTAHVIATVEFRGAEYQVRYTVKVTSLDADTSSVTNGGEIEYTQRELKNLLEDAIDDVYSSFSSNDITSIKLVENASGYLTLKDDSTTLRTGNSIDGTLTIAAKKGYIGDATFKLIVNNHYTVTLTVRVDGDKDIKDTVTGTSANKSVTFTNSDYDSLYIYEGSSFKTEKYDGDWSKTSGHTDWKLVSKNKDYTVSTSAFDKNGKATLYVVAVDDGIASTGTITVSQKSYDINYNVVAGKSVSFNQKDFESFLEDYAEDNGKYNPKKDEITFDHATLNSLPTAKSEGTLYYGGSEVTSTSNRKAEYTDMDKMTFEAVAKPTKDTVTLTFRVYGEIEKPNSRKPDKVNYDVNVVISVVKEDITYTVGIDDTVQLTARDFVNFLQDAKTSYRKSTLDYVKFDVSGKNVSSYAYGGLYRSYSSYSTGKLADSTDKFYYEPSRTQYDLADVAYHTTRWAEAGKTVYIPFTVYGTKNEEASGTMAITIAQTMNFIDVKASDFFYEPVKWAVNNKITNGTSSTTFSPYKNCNRAEIVTFLWRAAGSPEPTVTRNPFTDVNSVRDASYYKAILWASQKGITAGTTATTFSPYQECTRSQIVTFLYRYAGKPSGYYSNPFKDVSSVNEASYYNAILWAVGKGITQGTSTTTFSPYASCTRGEAVTFLYRYVNGVK